MRERGGGGCGEAARGRRPRGGAARATRPLLAHQHALVQVHLCLGELHVGHFKVGRGGLLARAAPVRPRDHDGGQVLVHRHVQVLDAVARHKAHGVDVAGVLLHVRAQAAHGAGQAGQGQGAAAQQREGQAAAQAAPALQGHAAAQGGQARSSNGRAARNGRKGAHDKCVEGREGGAHAAAPQRRARASAAPERATAPLLAPPALSSPCFLGAARVAQPTAALRRMR